MKRRVLVRLAEILGATIVTMSAVSLPNVEAMAASLPVPDDGCAADTPIRVDPSGSVFDWVIVACTSYFGSELQITNVSKSVIRLTPDETLTWRFPYLPSTFNDVAMRTAVTGGLLWWSYEWDLLPGHSIRASSLTSPTVELSFVAYKTAAVYAADMIANWITGKLSPTSVRLRDSFVQCVTGVANRLQTSPKVWEDEIRSGIKTTVACGSVAEAILETAQPRVDVSRARAAQVFSDDVGRAADALVTDKSIAVFAFDDLWKWIRRFATLLA